MNYQSEISLIYLLCFVAACVVIALIGYYLRRNSEPAKFRLAGYAISCTSDEWLELMTLLHHIGYIPNIREYSDTILNEPRRSFYKLGGYYVITEDPKSGRLIVTNAKSAQDLSTPKIVTIETATQLIHQNK